MARTNFQVITGTYVGDGTDSRNISGVGFRPDLIIIKGGTNVTVWRNSANKGDVTLYLGAATTSLADAIQEILADGFQLGTNAVVNEAGTTFYYICMRGTAGQNYYRVGAYSGTGADDRNFTSGGLNFTPDIVWVKRLISDIPVLRTSSQAGDTSAHFTGIADTSDEIQNLQANGFQLGTSTRVNSATNNFYYFAAFKALAGVIAVGTYTGDATDNRAITGVGFQPNIVIVKNGSAANAAVLRTSDFVGDSSAVFSGTAPVANQIQSFDADGFTVGTAANVNQNGSTFWWIAFKSGNHNVPITRTLG